MNARRLLVLVSILICVLLVACQAQATSVALTVPPPTDAPAAQVTSTDSLAPTTLSETPGIGKLLEMILLPVNPNRDSVYAFDSLWLPNDADGTVTRWDPAARQVLATITVGDPRAEFGLIDGQNMAHFC